MNFYEEINEDFFREKQAPVECLQEAKATRCNLLDPREILRCGKECNIIRLEKHLALLDASHHVTLLIVKACHARVYHNGVKETMTQLRSRFWIARREASCKENFALVYTHRWQGNPYSPPNLPVSPLFRITKDQPFTCTGVDFAGPLNIKENGDTRKTYISIYTCAVSRAVHLDTVPDLTAEAFIRNFRRFFARIRTTRTTSRNEFGQWENL